MVFFFERVTGPECPKCGCEDGDGEPPDDRNGAVPKKYRRTCNFCGWRFWVAIAIQVPRAIEPERETMPETMPAPAPYRVVYERLRCPSPECGSTEIRTTSSPKPEAGASLRIRYHKCRSCERLFSSYETLKQETDHGARAQ
jgi:transcriptional regulator NrdR family protein